MTFSFRRHWSYLKYVMKHKAAVFTHGLQFMSLLSLRDKPSYLWRLIIHDFSKFRPSEWLPYAQTFYAPDGSKQYRPKDDFAYAWKLHQHRNSHHWQYHLIVHTIGGDLIPLPHTQILVWDKGNADVVRRNNDTITIEPLGLELSIAAMPLLDMIEMLADWCGAGYAINGDGSLPAVYDWYSKQTGMKLHPKTREVINTFFAKALDKKEVI